MNILLMESHYRSRSWFRALIGLGELYIVSVLPGERRLFLSSGIKSGNILDLHNPQFNQVNYEQSRDFLADAEVRYKFIANEVILSDRTLRLKSDEYVTAYLAYIIEKIEHFIDINKIGVTFIEPTWAHEILTCRICEAKGVTVWAPVKSKLLPDKFFFFHGDKNEVSFERRAPTDVQEITAQVLKSVDLRNKPQYFGKFNTRSKLTLAKFKVFFDITMLAILGHKNSNIQAHWWAAISRKVAAITRAPFLIRFAGFCKQSDIADPYVLVTLHVQPEASIDVVGGKYADQLNFIRCVARSTPSSHVVVVKEHPHAFGDRPLSFYRELLAIPRVCIMSPWEESRVAIVGADLVISNTGTSSLEAAILGIPAVTATRMYFSSLMITPEFNPSIQSVASILSASKGWTERYSESWIKSQLQVIAKNIFKGNCGDFKTDPNVMTDKNIQYLRLAFREVIDSNA
jgi:hypothetical protein